MTQVEFQDSLELLLRDCDPQRMAVARRVTTAMRLLLANTREGRSPSAAVRTDSARDELNAHRRRRIGGRLTDLLAHLAGAHARSGSFLRFPAPRASYTDTWAALLKILDQQGRDRLGLEVPMPTASGKDVLGRVLDVHGEHAAAVPGGIEELQHLHWRARILWVVDGDRAPFLESLQRIAQRARPLGDGEARQLLAGILADTLALHLDGGSLAQAMEIVRALGWAEGTHIEKARPGEDGRARAYAAMTCWLYGATDIAPHWAAGSGASERSGPFGEDVPRRWSRLLDCIGPAAAAPAPVPVAEPAPGLADRLQDGLADGLPDGAEPPWIGPITRRDLGARAMIVRTFDGARGLRVASADVAPALREELKAWERSRQYAASEPGSPEYVMVGAGRRASTIVQCASEPLGLGLGASITSTGDARAVRGPLAVVCEPLFDEASELVGCLWLEFDHRLLPSDEGVHAAARLVAHQMVPHGARASAQALDLGATNSASRMAAVSADLSVAHLEDGGWAAGLSQDGQAPLRAAWIELLNAVLGKTQERRWVAFHWDCLHSAPGDGGEAGNQFREEASAPPANRRTVCVAAGGDGDLGEWTGAAEPILRRSMMAAATIRYGRAGAQMTSFAGALQGAAIPVTSGGQVIGALVVESSRRGDLSAGDIDRWSAAVNRSAGQLEVAHIHGRDLGAHEGGGFELDAAAPDADAWLAQVRALSRARTDVLVLGELGSGRRTAARAIHHVGALLCDPGPLATIEAFGVTAPELERRLQDAARGSLVLAGIDSLDQAAQGVLASWMSRPRSGRARLLATAGAGSDSCSSAAAHENSPGRHGSKAPARAFPGADQDGALAAGLQLEHRQLATSLMRAVLRVEPLRNRRHWIPPMAQAMLARIAAREGGDALELHDEAAALLWRQPWPGNGLDLEALLYSACLAREALSSKGAILAKAEQSAGQLSASDLTDAFLALGAQTTGRLASRDPSIADLAAAAWTTQTASGRINKTRAGLYLGWDPATVTTRIREAGLGELETAAAALLRPRGAEPSA